MLTMLVSMLLKKNGSIIDQLLSHPSVPSEARWYLLAECQRVGELPLARVAKVVAAYREASSCISSTD
jgi:hypothetical protein